MAEIFHAEETHMDLPPVREDRGRTFGCLQCQLSCQTHAGQAARMFKVHGHIAKLRKYFVEPTCPACLKVSTPCSIDIYYSHQCRQILQSRPPSDHIAPGAGSSIGRAMTAEPDCLSPLLQAAALNQVPRLRADPNIDDVSSSTSRTRFILACAWKTL